MRDGAVKGQPRRFVNGHNRRKGAADHVVNENGCWIWQRATARGYGLLTRSGRKHYAHRWFYEQAKGAIPSDWQVDHECDTPLCVNPDHLVAKPRRDNIRRTHARLTDAQIETILSSTDSARKLAREFGVSHMTVLRVRNLAPSEFEMLNGFAPAGAREVAWAA